MSSQPQPLEPYEQERVRALYLLGAFIPLFIPTDFFFAPRFHWSMALLRILWGGLLVLSGLLLPRLPKHRRSIPAVIASVGSYGSYLGLVASMGIAEAPILLFAPAMPLAVALLMRDEVKLSFVLGAAFCVGLTAMLHFSGMETRQVLLYATLLNGGLVTSCVATASFRRQVRLEARLLAELTEAERRRDHSERLALVGQLAAGVAHEVNNPLAYVSANLDFLRDELTRSGPVEGELADVLEESRQGCRRIAQIVTDLKVLTLKGDAVVPLSDCDAIDVRAAVEEASRLASVRIKSVAELSLSLGDGPLEARAEARRLVQVVLNLLTNAADAVASSGHRGHVRVAVEKTPPGVEISVEDDGIGLPADQSRLFSPFFTTKPPGKGTGLGLSVSRSFVQQWGGRLSCAPRAGGGATFRVFLPNGPAGTTAAAA